MIPVGGRPMLGRTIEWLRSLGIEEIAINLHHRPDDITRFLGDGTAHGVRIRYSFEPMLLGTAGALRPLAEWLVEEGQFLIVYADNLIHCDLQALTALHERLQATATVALFQREDVSASGVAELDAEGRIRAFKEKPKSDETDSHWVNAGLIVCEPRVVDFVPDSGLADFGIDVLPALIEAGERVVGYRMGPRESLHWIDTPEDLARVDALLGGA
jgi:mannose-1-phosphate guanylyltransferase